MAAWAIPLAELSAAAGTLWLLLSSRHIRRAAIPLLAAFGALTLYATVLSVSPPARPAGCGCGLSSTPINNWWPLAIRNGACTAVIAACWAWPSGRMARA